MEATDITLQSLIYSPRQFIVPVFQRYYSWKKKNWETLWNDIQEILESEDPNRTHFLGSMVFFPLKPTLSGRQALLVIDGQQRLMTFSIILCALRYVAKELKFTRMVEEVTENFLIHKFADDFDRYRIYPRHRDRDDYLLSVEFITNEIEGRIGNAQGYFVGKIKSLGDPVTQENLVQLFDLIKGRLQFVYILLDAENPYQIFKSLNSTGVDLSEADLIRNYVFMHLDLDTQDKFDDIHWKYLEDLFLDSEGKLDAKLITNFFRSFLMKDGQYVPANSVFEHFENRYEKSTDFNPENLTRELIVNALEYNTIRGVLTHKSDFVAQSLNKLLQLDSSTTYPLLLNLFLRNRENKMSDEDLSRAIEILAGFILRRYACNESSRGYGRIFVSACKSLGDKPLENLLSYLKDRSFPRDERFVSGFTTFPWYERGYTRVVLEALERDYGHKEQADLSVATIEHIMPRTLSDQWKSDLGPDAERVYEDWLHTIGNLTLSAYNPELWNHPFTTKQEEYEKSNITLNKEIADYDCWAEKEIKNRASLLAERAVNIWIGPDT